MPARNASVLTRDAALLTRNASVLTRNAGAPTPPKPPGSLSPRRTIAYAVRSRPFEALHPDRMWIAPGILIVLQNDRVVSGPHGLGNSRRLRMHARGPSVAGSDTLRCSRRSVVALQGTMATAAHSGLYGPSQLQGPWRRRRRDSNVDLRDSSG
jgi:hypothetical protein